MVWMWVVREREFTDEATDLGQSLWKSGVAMDWGGRRYSAGWWRSVISFSHIKFVMPNVYLDGDVKWAIAYRPVFQGKGLEWTWSLPVTSTVLCLVAQSCPTLCNPMDCSLSDSSVHRDSPGENTGGACHVLSSSRGSSKPRFWTQVSRIAGGFFTIWATK